jgi:hypothetical protein
LLGSSHFRENHGYSNKQNLGYNKQGQLFSKKAKIFLLSFNLLVAFIQQMFYFRIKQKRTEFKVDNFNVVKVNQSKS